MNIFISYRHADSSAESRSLFIRLREHFGKDRVFYDQSALVKGVDFVAELSKRFAGVGALVAVIGPHWANTVDENGNRRLQNPTDYVRSEIESALGKSIPIIPVLVSGARMPTADEVPPSLSRFVNFMAAVVTHANFETDSEALIKALEPIVGPPSWLRRTSASLSNVLTAVMGLPRALRYGLLALLVVLATQLVAPNSIGSGYEYLDAVRRVGLNASRVPLSQATQTEIKAILASTEDQYCENFRTAKVADDVWATSQQFTACGAPASLFPAFKQKVMGLIDQSCKCWPFAKAQRLYLNFWVLEAYSMNQEQIDDDVLTHLLSSQNKDGYWPTDFEQVQQNETAPLYVTAMMVIALSNQAPFVTDSALKQDVARAVRTGAAWLARQQPENPDDWADYPMSVRAVRHRLFGGMALTAIAPVLSAAQRDYISVRWTRDLNFDPAHLFLGSDSLAVVPSSQLGDNYRHVALTWEICGVVAAWPGLPLRTRTTLLIKLEDRIHSIFASARPFGREWVQADVTYCLRTLEKAAKGARKTAPSTASVAADARELKDAEFAAP